MTTKPDVTGMKHLKPECLTCPRLEDGQRGLEDRFCHWRECELARQELQLAQHREALENLARLFVDEKGGAIGVVVRLPRQEIHAWGLPEREAPVRAAKTFLANPDPSGLLERLKAGEAFVQAFDEWDRAVRGVAFGHAVPVSPAHLWLAVLDARDAIDKAVGRDE